MAEPEEKKSPEAAPFRTYARDVAVLTGKPLAAGTLNVPAPAPVAPVPQAPVPIPPPPPAYIIPKAPSTGESEEEVLTRLRAKVAGAAPIVLSPELVMPQPPAPATPLSVPPPTPARPQPPEGPTPIHTYKTDFAREVKEQGADRISIVAAEQDSGRTTVATLSPQRKRHPFMIAGAVLLILAGLAGVYFAYRYVQGKSAVPPETFVPSLIFADERVELKGSGEELRQALANAEGADSLSQGGVMIAYITYATTTKQGTVHTVASGGDLIVALRLPAPSILLRNIEPESTVGVVRAGEEARPFFIFKASSYERTFAGLLDWEATMQDDLALFYPPYPEVMAEPTASTTEPGLPPARLMFSDQVVENRDVRVLKDAQGRTLMLYGYRDKATLIIARDEAAFSELLTRLNATRAQ